MERLLVISSASVCERRSSMTGDGVLRSVYRTAGVLAVASSSTSPTPGRGAALDSSCTLRGGGGGMTTGGRQPRLRGAFLCFLLVFSGCCALSPLHFLFFLFPSFFFLLIFSSFHLALVLSSHSWLDVVRTRYTAVASISDLAAPTGAPHPLSSPSPSSFTRRFARTTLL